MKSIKTKCIIIAILILAVSLMAVGCIINQSKTPENNQAGTTPKPAVTESPVSTPVPTSIPITAPSVTPVPTPSPITATLVSAGDCVIHNTLQRAAKIDGEDRYDFTHMFEEIKPFVESADYSVVSYEGAATNSRNDYSGFPYFNCPPEIFDAFKYSGFDLVNNANNHQLDRRVKGMLETRDNIRGRGLDVIGAYDGEEQRYIIKDLNGINVGFMAYTYGSNGNEGLLTSEQIAKHLAFFDKARMEKEIKELEEKADITVVLMHWGHEYWRKPNEQQISLSNDLFEWGADVILGSHPHVIQPTEVRTVNGETKYIIYSMGNFLTNQWHEWFDNPKDKKWLREDSILVTIEFLKDPVTQKTVINKVKHIPTWLSREGVGTNTVIHRILPVPTRDYYDNSHYPEELIKKAYESYDRTIDFFTDYERESF
ncbi:MAG TPA: CapA family protein [Clostridiaceae bacterium]|nr:CapA family protein [Clostridiaceae bacterium]